MELVLTIAADGEFLRCGSAARASRTIPTTLTSNTRCHSSPSLAVTSPCAPIPALLTRMSRRPKRSTTASIADVTSSSEPTSQRIPSSPGFRSSTATRAPRSASRVATALPMPEAPPVTAATRPSNSLTCGLRPLGTVREPEPAQRGVVHARGEPGSGRGQVAAALDDGRVGEVLVQVVDPLDRAVRVGAGHRHEVEHRQVPDELAEPDPTGGRADRHAELGGQQQDGEVLVEPADAGGVQLQHRDRVR